MKANLYPLLLLLFVMTSCWSEPEDRVVQGLRPIYITPSIDSIYAKGPLEMENLGKIVYVDPFIFINERLKGIHVIDNTDPSLPENIAFWQIPGNTDFTVESPYLYAENSRDLYTIDISDIHEIVVVNEVKDIYTATASEQFYPEDYSGDFECVDPVLGVVVGWQVQTLTNPNCFR